MIICNYVLVLCFGVVLSARLAMAMNSYELQKLMSKINNLMDKMQEVEKTMQATNEKTDAKFQKRMEEMENTLQMAMNEMEPRLQEKLIKHESNINKKIDMLDTKFETKMLAMEESFKKSVKTAAHNTREKIEELKNHLVSKMDGIQETSLTELKKLGESKDILRMLVNSTHNLTTNLEIRSKTLEDHLIAPIRSCRQVTAESGTYLFRLWKSSKQFDVFCEQNKFESGWIVIQHRYDGSVDFYRNWTEYRNGFGNVDGEFWLGLEYVHHITKNRPHELLVEMKDFHGNYGYAKYDEFEIGDESEWYALKKLGTYSGTAGDSMEYHKNKKFTTFDRDNDEWNSNNCAKDWHGAWWYNHCHHSNLNGRYQNTTGDWSAMVWHHFTNDNLGLSYTRMMIRDLIN